MNESSPTGDTQPPSFPRPEAPLSPTPPPTGQYVQVRYTGQKPVVVYAILGITILVYLLQIGSQYLTGVDLPGEWGVKSNTAILQGQLWRLFTPMLLHGSILHIGFNMYALYSIGMALESHFGRKRFLALYIIAGFAGNVLSFILTTEDSLGASTAIFGLLGAYGIFLYQNRSLFGNTARRALTNIITIAVVNLLIGLSPGIDNWGHVGGLIGGTLFAWLGGPLLQLQPGYPYYNLVDKREPGEVWRAGLTAGGVFVVVAAVVIFLRLR